MKITKARLKQIIKEEILKEFGYDNKLNNPVPELPDEQKIIDDLIDLFFENKVGIDAVIKQIKATKASTKPSVSSYMFDTFKVLLQNLELKDRERLEAALIEYGITPEALKI